MRIVKAQLHKLDKDYYFLPEFAETAANQPQVGQMVVVATALGEDLAKILFIGEMDTTDLELESELKPLLRPASELELKQASDNTKHYPEYLKVCRQLVEQNQLKEMKLIDVAESFDGSRLTFYFISNSRVDFRELVKGLVNNFHKKIRLQQIGVRDAAKAEGDFGPCGLSLCCRSWLSTLGNVNPDLIKNQALSHRGAERLTGVCGRLKCCLRFEEDNYRWQDGKTPQVGDMIKTKNGEGRVKAVYPEKLTVDLELAGQTVEYPYTEGNKCKVLK